MTEAQKKANKKWKSLHGIDKYDKMTIEFHKGMKEIIKNNAQKKDLSIPKYLTKLVMEDAENEN